MVCCGQFSLIEKNTLFRCPRLAKHKKKLTAVFYGVKDIKDPKTKSAVGRRSIVDTPSVYGAKAGIKTRWRQEFIL